MRVLVVRAGAMGSQIAMVTALAGIDVALHDVESAVLAEAHRSLRQRMNDRVAKGRIDASNVESGFEHLALARELDVAAATSDLGIEAVVEGMVVKRDVFSTLDEICPHTILASNSSSFLPSRLAASTQRPGLVCNLHFFNPALVMRCVDVVPGLETSDSTVAAAVAFVERLGKTPVVLDHEIPGFIAIRLLNAVRDEAIRLYKGGVAGVETIDVAARTALGHPMGPFELMDLTGIDIGYQVKQARYAETGAPSDLPSGSVTRLVEAGNLGRKSGRGWYSYPDPGEA